MADALVILAAVAIGLALVLALWRFVVGPAPADRVAAFDVATIVSISGIVLASLVTGREIFLDVALVYALLSFLGVIAVSRYLEGGEE